MIDILSNLRYFFLQSVLLIFMVMEKQELLRELKFEVARVVDTYSTKDIEEVNITEESDLVDLGLDSLDVVILAMELERKYQFNLKDEETRNWHTVGDVLKTLMIYVP